jgi:hypothetical protein
LLLRKEFILPTYKYATFGFPQEETLYQLLCEHPFAAKRWDVVCPQRMHGLSSFEAIEDIKSRLQLSFPIDFYIMETWSIWIPNNKIFNSQQPIVQMCKLFIIRSSIC